MVRLTIRAVAALLAGVPLAALAQGGAVPASPERGVAAPASVATGATGAIVGVARDSLHAAPLAEAVITVVELPQKSALSSASGAFRIDSLPPGRYTLEMMHPVLDSLGIRVVSDTIVVAAGAVQAAELSIPSAEALAAAVCSPARRRLGPGAIVGQVLDAESGAPVAGAEVSVVWVETEVSTTTGVRSAPRVRKSTTEANGTYRVCGVPASFAGAVQAVRGGVKTAEVRVAAESPLSLRFLRLPPAKAVTAAAPGSELVTGNATITGKVTNRGGDAVIGASVTVQGSTAAAKTAADGSFTLTRAPAGTQVVIVRHVGYTPVEVPTDVTSRGPNTLAVRLGTFVPSLPHVEVRAKGPAPELERSGFTHRQKMGLGRFLTEADVEKAQPVYASDVLRRLPGLHVIGSGHDTQVVTSRGNGCVTYLVDRNNIDPQQGLTIDDVVRPDEIAGIEFYQASEVPMQFETRHNSGCGLVVVWTREQLKAADK